MSRYPFKKSEWGPGPWQDEPDRLEFRSSHGLPCLIRRHTMGFLCGYVAVPPGHPFHGRRWDGIELHAHGGINYSDRCFDDICHKPEKGESDDVWWFGFDCGHAFDLIPAHEAFMREIPGFIQTAPEFRLHERYCDIDYVRSECEALAQQLVEAAHEGHATVG